MKTTLITLAIGSVMIIGGCNKTKKVSTTTVVSHADPQEMDVNVEVEGGEIIVMINGEEQVIDLSEIMGDVDLGNFVGADGEVKIGVMVYGDEDAPTHMMHGGDAKDGVHHRMMEWNSDQGGPQHGMEEMHERMMQMHGKHGGPPEGMREHMMQMRGEHGNPHQKMQGEWRGHQEERDVPEEHQFMDELSMLDDISHMMTPSSMAMLGIHMIRDELEPENRIEALERIIEQTEKGSTSRNAALIVAIQTLQELHRQEEAAGLMVELVVSN